MAIISLPLIKANWKSGVVSEDENRYLTDTPKLIEMADLILILQAMLKAGLRITWDLESI